MSAVHEARARVAGLRRNRPPHDPRVVDAVRDLRAAKLEAYVTKVVAEAPPLTPEQRDRLAVILAGGDAA